MSDNLKEMNGSVFVPKTISNILAAVSLLQNSSKGWSMLNAYINAFEEEAKKVQTFTSELPHCMDLLQDAIKVLKEEAQRWKGQQHVEPVMEEYLPLKGDERAKQLIDNTDKGHWMSSAQPSSNQRNTGFDTKDNHNSLLPFKSGLTFKLNKGGSEAPQQSERRKDRRCWSLELHEKFVQAIDVLGGADVATPKQIRQFMNIQGLTNDEVKSHLQKYRLHHKKVRASVGPSIARR